MIRSAVSGCFFLLFCVFTSKGQENYFNQSRSINSLTIRHWTADNGLSSNNITDIFKDSNGLIWITSFNGFMIYDSETFEIYDVNNLDILSTDGFYKVVESPDSTIYLGSQGSGILAYKNAEFFQVQTSFGEVPKLVRSFWVNNDGSLFAGTNGDGLYLIKNDSTIKIPGDEIESVTIKSIYKDSQQNLWIGTEGQGLFKIDKEYSIKSFSTNQGLLNNNISDIKSFQGKILLATNNGLQFVNSNDHFESVPKLEEIYVNCFVTDQDRVIWIGSEKGLYRWDTKTDKLEVLNEKKGVDFVRLSSLKIDDQKNLWVTSNRTGLVQMREGDVENLLEPELSSNRVYIVKESRDKSMLIGTDQNHLERYDGNSVSSIPIKTDLKGNGVRDILHQENGTYWLATYSGIIKIDPSGEKVFNSDWGMPVNNFRLVLEKEGELWFGSRSGGLVRFKEDQIIENYKIGNKLNSNFILALTKDQEGNIYVGTHSGGMTIFYENGTSKSFKIKDDDSGILIFNIDPTNDGNAYLTLNIGPAYFDGDSIKLIKLRKDRISKTYFDIVDDQVGNLWVTTNIGILKIRKLDWFDYLNGKIDEVNYRLIDESNGMNNKECTGATQSTLGSDGNIYFPTLGGVAIINPKKFNVDQSDSKIILRHLFGDNTEYNVKNSNLRMPPGTQRFRFQFALLSFANPKRNQYRYSLIGFDEGWSKPTYSNNVEYTNLPPGNYTFEVVGSQDGTNWENSIASVSFKVLPFFYQTIGFYFLIILAIVGVFLVIYKWRISFIDRQNQKLKKVNEELDRFVYSASHELRSPLSSVLGLVQYAQTEENLKDVQDYLYHIEKSVSRLDGLIGDIIDYSRNARTTISIEPINMYELVYDVADGISFADYFKKVELNVTDNSTSLLISDPKRVKIILSNIITNAFKHHDPKNIKKPVVNIKIENHKEGLLVIVEDNGPGIDEKFQKDVFKMFYRATVETEGSGLGLYIVKETMEKLKGKINFKSVPGTGTTFELYFPNLDLED